MSDKKPAAATRTNTVRLHRVFAAKPQKVYRAFLEANAIAKWLPPDGFICHVEHMTPKVGGTFRMSFTNFTTGKSHSFGGEYLEVVPHERIRYTDSFDDPNLPGIIHVTIALKAVLVGTEVNIEQSGLPAVIPVEACYLGWQQRWRSSRGSSNLKSPIELRGHHGQEHHLHLVRQRCRSRRTVLCRNVPRQLGRCGPPGARRLPIRQRG